MNFFPFNHADRTIEKVTKSFKIPNSAHFKSITLTSINPPDIS